MTAAILKTSILPHGRWKNLKVWRVAVRDPPSCLAAARHTHPHETWPGFPTFSFCLP